MIRAEQQIREATQEDLSNIEVPVPTEPSRSTGAARGEPDPEMAAPPTRQVTPEPPAPEPSGQTPETGDDINIEDLLGEPEAIPEHGEVVHDVHVLKNKSSSKGKMGKELAPKYFDEQKWKKFQKAANKQWERHLKNDAVEVMLPKAAAKVPASKICKATARFVRVNRAEGREHLQAKSRMVVPGHELGRDQRIRRDAPVAPQVALYMLFSDAVQDGWKVSLFDVQDAFLVGWKNERVPTGSPLRFKKGAFGFPEAARL